MQNSAEIINIKLIVLGGTGAGKTSLISRFMGKEISKVRLPTIGYSILKKDYNLELNNYIIRINIWDSGRIFLLKSNPSFFVGADIALLVFDLSKPKELSEFKKFYLQNLEKYAQDCTTILVGNKLDLISIKKDLKQIIKENLTTDDDLLVISAKNGDKIDDSFELLILNLLKYGRDRFPNLDLEETSKEFADVIGKSEDELRKLIINLSNIDTVSDEIELQIKSAKTDALFAEKGIINYSLLQSELKKIEDQKLKLKNDFIKKLTEANELVNYVKKSNIKSVEGTVNNLKDQLIIMQNNFEESLDYLEKLENEKINLIKIINEGRPLEKELLELLEKKKLEKKELEKKELEKKELEKEKLEKKELEKEKLEKKELEKERLEKKELEKERLEKKELEKERLEKKELEKEKLETEVLEKEVLKPVKKVIDKKIARAKTTDEIKILSVVERKLPEIEEKNNSKPGKKPHDDIKVISVVQKITEKEKIAESISRNNLYQIFEKENPGKKSVWRGNETKSFIAWKKKYLQIKIIKEGE